PHRSGSMRVVIGTRTSTRPRSSYVARRLRGARPCASVSPFNAQLAGGSTPRSFRRSHRTRTTGPWHELRRQPGQPLRSLRRQSWIRLRRQLGRQNVGVGPVVGGLALDDLRATPCLDDVVLVLARQVVDEVV